MLERGLFRKFDVWNYDKVFIVRIFYHLFSDYEDIAE